MTQKIEDMDRTKVVIPFTDVKLPYGWLGNMAAKSGVFFRVTPH